MEALVQGAGVKKIKQMFLSKFPNEVREAKRTQTRDFGVILSFEFDSVWGGVWPWLSSSESPASWSNRKMYTV
jgi:hypothetical protein